MIENFAHGKHRYITKGLQAICGSAVLSLAVVGTSANAAPIVLESGYTIDVYASGLNSPMSLAVDSSGLLYIGEAGTNQIVTVATPGGSKSVFATGLSNPMGMVWGSGAFGTDLYVADGVAVNGPVRVMQVGAGGGAATQFFQTSNSFTETWPFDLDIDQSGDYGGNMFVVDSGGPDSVLEVTSSGASSVLAGVPENLSGLEFSHSGSAFTEGLYTFHEGSGLVQYIDPLGSTTVLATLTNGLADGRFGLPGSGFGDRLFLTDAYSDKILAVNSDGTSSEFASGFNFNYGPPWISGSMAFSNDGNTLYVINEGQGEVLRIQSTATVPEPAPFLLLGAGLLGLALRRKLQTGLKR